MMKLRGLLPVHQKSAAAVALGWLQLFSYMIGPSYAGSFSPIGTVASSTLSVSLSFTAASCLLFWPMKEATAFSISSAFGSEPVDPSPKEEEKKNVKTGNSDTTRDSAYAKNSPYPASHTKSKANTAVRSDTGAVSSTGAAAAAQEREQQEKQLPPPPDGMTRFRHANQLLFPLVGVGIGNLHANDVAILLEGAPEQVDNLPLMIDTSHKSGTEAAVARGILAREAMLGPLPSNMKRTYHIVTKVWYTHLGYERTKLSVAESLRSLKSVLQPDSNNPTEFKIRLTMLLHWPRCRDDFEWMECQAEEAALPHDVKQYPSPLTRPNKAYLDSWRALEEFFVQGRLDAIGVSNFEVSDMKPLLETAKIQPHLHQISSWSMYNEPDLMYLMRNATSMVYQVNNVMQVFGQGATAPGAYRFMWELGQVNGGYAPHIMGLAWMMQHHISVIPSTRNWDHLEENSVAHLLQVPTLNSVDARLVRDAIGCLIDQEDNDYFREFSHIRQEKEELDQYREKERRETVETRFVNRVNRPVQLWWVDPETGERHPQGGEVSPGHEAMVRSHRDHIFLVYEAGADTMNHRPLQEFQVRRGPGEMETFHVEL
jgi:diketogulonate reductase-like aldo/keto reductase